MLQTTLGTGFEPDTDGAILVLEDRGMKPYQVDRALRHLYQAGKFKKVSGVLLGDFPDCEPPAPGGPTIPEICEEILGPLKVPLVYGAPIGHTKRPMLTLPLGVRAKLQSKGEGTLEILEPAVVD
jgi:muramoyltetrapeptide carboxypeptidase